MSHTVWIIDDDNSIRWVLEKALEQANITTRVFEQAEPALAARFGIRAIPTLALFHGGREIARHSGAMSQAMIRDWVAAHLSA